MNSKTLDQSRYMDIDIPQLTTTYHKTVGRNRIVRSWLSLKTRTPWWNPMVLRSASIPRKIRVAWNNMKYQVDLVKMKRITRTKTFKILVLAKIPALIRGGGRPGGTASTMKFSCHWSLACCSTRFSKKERKGLTSCLHNFINLVSEKPVLLRKKELVSYDDGGPKKSHETFTCREQSVNQSTRSTKRDVATSKLQLQTPHQKTSLFTLRS